MSTLQDLSSAIQHVAEATGPSIVGIGRRRARLGRRHRRRPRADQRPQHPRRRGHRDLRRRSLDASGGSRASTRTATSRSSRSTRRVRRPSTGARATQLDRRQRRLRRRGDADRRHARHVRHRLGRGARVPRPRRPTHRGQHRAHRAPRPGLVRRSDPRRRGSVPRPQHEPPRRGLLPRPAGRCRPPRPGRCPRRGESVERPRLGVAVAPSHVARRLRRSVGLPERDGLLVRDVEEGSPAARAGIVDGDLIVVGRRQARHRCRRAGRGDRRGRRHRSRCASFAGPRNGPSPSAATHRLRRGLSADDDHRALRRTDTSANASEASDCLRSLDEPRSSTRIRASSARSPSG